MTTLSEIVRQYGAAYRAQYGEQMLPSQHAALRAIEQCRTEALRPPLRLPGLRQQALQLPFLPQPPLSDLPARRHPELAREPAPTAVAGALLPGHLHATSGTA